MFDMWLSFLDVFFFSFFNDVITLFAWCHTSACAIHRCNLMCNFSFVLQGSGNVLGWSISNTTCETFRIMFTHKWALICQFQVNVVSRLLIVNIFVSKWNNINVLQITIRMNWHNQIAYHSKWTHTVLNFCSVKA